MSRDDYGRSSRRNRSEKADCWPTIRSPRSTRTASGADEDGRGEGAATTRHKLKIGICGEHGGDPATVVFCHKIGLNYVSCSPFRVPIARLAAAQAALGK